MKLRRLWMHHFGYGTKMEPLHTYKLKKDIRLRLLTEDYTCRLLKIKPRIRYKLRSTWYWAGDEQRGVWK